MDQKLLIGVVIGLVIGGAGGYFAAAAFNTSAQGQNASTPITQEQAQQAATDATVKAVGNVQTNPYENVKTNPFDY